MRWVPVVLGVAAIAAAAFVIRSPRAPVSGPLAPDPGAVRYRHPITAPAAGDRDAAIAALEVRAQVPSVSPFDLTELAELYLARARVTGDPADHAAAEATARRSLVILPAPNAAVLVLAHVAAARHDFTEAIELARRHEHGRSTGALAVLATAHLATGELGPAAAAAEALVFARPTASAYLTRALVLAAQGRDAEAAFDFTRACAAEDAGDVDAAARLRALWARFLIRRGELAGAEQVIAEALRIAPDHPLALAQRGELALRAGRPRDARALFERAFAGSRQVRYLIDQARAQDRAGDRTGADALRGQVERIVRGELADGGAGHRLDLVEVLIDRGDPAGVGEAIALAREEVARRGSTEARLQLARGLARAGGRDDALAQLQVVLAAGAREAPVYRLAAALERERGNPARAAIYDRLARELDPSGTVGADGGADPR